MSLITPAWTSWTSGPLILRGGSYFAEMSRDQFFEFCQQNPDVPMERTAEGDLVIMTPAGTESGEKSGEVYFQLTLWNKKTGLGHTFDSSAGLTLPNGAVRSPDATWVTRERWQVLKPEERRKFAAMTPDFVAEVRSPSDSLTQLQDKMQEYADNGVRLGWLIDPIDHRVEIHRPGQTPVVLDRPMQLSGDPELPGFVLDLTPIW